MIRHQRAGRSFARAARPAWLLLLVGLLASCAHRVPPPAAPAAPVSETATQETGAQIVQPAPWPADFTASATALEAFRRACPRLLVRTDHSGLTRADDWRPACAAADQAGAQADSDPTGFFRRHFTPVRLGSGRGLATGYYEPLVKGHARAVPGAAPILARPPELVDVDLSAFGVTTGGAVPAMIRGVVRDGRLRPAPTRAEIEDGAYAGRQLELGWATDPVDLFFLQIQGSGRLALPDGSSFRIGYAAQNGHPYVAIGRLLRERGLLDVAGMAEIRQWLHANPAAGRQLMRENQSYVFFRRLPDTLDGPIGALGVPLLAQANAAADPAFLPLGAPLWLSTEVEGAPFRRLLIASDTGGAIKGANRVDIFFGAGENAARMAGALAAPLDAILLLPAAAAARAGYGAMNIEN